MGRQVVGFTEAAGCFKSIQAPSLFHRSLRLSLALFSGKSDRRARTRAPRYNAQHWRRAVSLLPPCFFRRAGGALRDGDTAANIPHLPTYPRSYRTHSAYGAHTYLYSHIIRTHACAGRPCLPPPRRGLDTFLLAGRTCATSLRCTAGQGGRHSRHRTARISAFPPYPFLTWTVRVFLRGLPRWATWRDGRTNANERQEHLEQAIGP